MKFTKHVVLGAAFFALFFVSKPIQAQIVLQNSGDMRLEALKAYEEEKVEEAIKLLDEVYMGDTNYVAVQLLAGRMAYEQKDYPAVIKHCLNALSEPSGVQNEIYNILALAYHHTEMPDSADYYQLEAMARFPVDGLLQFNRGFVLYNRGQYQESEQFFKRSIELNPWFASAHYFMGYLAVAQGHAAHALMAWGFYMVLVDNNLSLLQEIEALSDGSFELDEKYRPAAAYATNELDALDDLIMARIALNSNFKTGIKLNVSLINQYKLLLDQYKPADNTADVYMKYYGPFYQQLKDENLLEPFTRYMIASADIADNNKWVKKKTKELEKVGNALQARTGAIMDRQQITLDGKEVDLECWYTNRKIEALGEVDNGIADNRVGYWYFFSSNGAMSAEGNFTNYKRNGRWKYYNDKGWLEYEVDFKDSEQHGIYRRYHDNGKLLVEGTYVDGDAQDTAKYYFSCGNLRKWVVMADDVEQGPERTFFRDGQLESQATYVDGKYKGSATTYFRNGKVEMELMYGADGELDGPYASYYDNGQLRSKGVYTAGKSSGKWSYYYRNGQLEREGLMDDAGLLQGKWVYFEENGMADMVLQFMDDELVGRQEYYDYDGKLVRVVTAEGASKFVKEDYLDEQGNVRQSYGDPDGNYAVVGYAVDGVMSLKGQYKDGLMTGTWQWFYSNGKLKSESNYQGGKKQGLDRSYSPNGQLTQEVTIKDGQWDGLFRSFYADGTLDRQGHYVAGEGEGRWEFYHEQGTLSERCFYRADSRHGYTELFSPLGKLRRIDVYQDGEERANIHVNREGKRFWTNDLRSGHGQQITPFTNGSISNKVNMVCSELQGESVWMNQKGVVLTRLFLRHSLRHGLYEQFYDNGKVKLTSYYVEGDLDSIYRTYYTNGQLEVDGRYSQGKRQGTFKFYHHNGKTDAIIQYDEEGNRLGWGKYFDQNGELIYEKFFVRGEATKVRYLLPNGSYAKEINVDVDSVAYTTYFKNGKVSAQERYYYGRFDGEIITYNSDGSLLERRMFINGIQHGIFEEGSLGGQMRRSGTFVNDDYHGLVKSYHYNGKLAVEMTYQSGFEEGPARFYDEAGELIREVYLWNNEEFELDAPR